MLVGERMKKPVLTIRPDVPVQDALVMMHKEHVRRFPVIDQRGKLVGMISEKDILNASPTEATSLSVWEINYLLSKITVDRIMTKNPITVVEDLPIEEAARIMSDKKVGALPVMRDGELVGIITETDLFKIFLELFGAREAGIRVTASIMDRPGGLAELSGAIYKLGGNIIAFGTFQGESPEKGLITFKVGGVTLEALKEAVLPHLDRIIDIRETH